MTAPTRPAWISPSLPVMPGGEVPAYELKFLLTEPAARELEVWAAAHLTRDPYADPARGGRYQVTSVYFDTPGLDVLRRADGCRRDKHRVRRYGAAPVAYLERKSKARGRVSKCRVARPLDQIAALLAATDGPTGEWFALVLADLGLRPSCVVTYDQTAFVGTGPTGPVRLTLDRDAVSRRADGLDVTPVADGSPLLRDEVIAEFKFLVAMPALFREVIAALRLTPSAVSKYRRCAAAVGLPGEEVADA